MKTLMLLAAIATPAHAAGRGLRPLPPHRTDSPRMHPQELTCGGVRYSYQGYRPRVDCETVARAKVTPQIAFIPFDDRSDRAGGFLILDTWCTGLRR